MIVDHDLERRYQSIELVRGSGDRWRDQLCIMSLVAFLSGERHTDNPETASVVIRCFAITINDAIPSAFRQRLKPFAPRIIGTRDGQDRVRGELLMRAAMSEILPRAVEDFGSSLTSSIVPKGPITHSGKCNSQLHQLLPALTRLPLRPRKMTTCLLIAHLTARLLAHCGRIADNERVSEWYRVEALDLLDRLCDVGANRRRKTLELCYIRGTAPCLDSEAALDQHSGGDAKPEVTANACWVGFGESRRNAMNGVVRHPELEPVAKQASGFLVEMV
jgi:hypothetical protein